MLPSGCSADWCYTYPEEQGGHNRLVPVPTEAAEALQKSFYPEGVELMRTSPLWFSEVIDKLVWGIEPVIPVVDVHNVWDVFSSILSLIEAYDSSWISNPSNDPSQTIAAQALHENWCVMLLYSIYHIGINLIYFPPTTSNNFWLNWNSTGEILSGHNQIIILISLLISFHPTSSLALTNMIMGHPIWCLNLVSGLLLDFDQSHWLY